ncbi:heavy metal translocating P-type ATPase [Sanguibacter gelidistatuariae]|uniref:heavy metal translocating P-type ATPase n=1 Tax=Sanguibacter gelidistatuariae TaxID=1814289 RepID=UPI00316AE0E0
MALTVCVAVVALVLSGAGASPATRWLVSAYALAVALRQGWSMVADIRRGTWGVDILAVTAIVATVAVGEFWASLVIVLMLSGGEALEDVAAGRARRELTSLLDRAPSQAHVETADGSVVDRPVAEITIGQTLVVKPGEMVPVDATVLSDTASFDESSITGESLPVDRRAGETVLSGAVNGPHLVRVQAVEVAANSQYQRIVELVESASGSRAPFVRMADRYAVPFTAFAFLLAGLAWWVSGDVVRFAEVLVVATPCPLLIAAPVAFIAGMSRAAKNGIIVKDGGALERLARVRTVAFDKTGTLTYGAPRVSRVLPVDGVSDDALVALVAAAEQYSAHVLARAFVEEANDRGLVVDADAQVEEVPGFGLRATVAGRRVVVGKASFVADAIGETAAGHPGPTSAQGAAVPGGAVREVQVRLAGGETAVYAAVDGAVWGAIVLADEIRGDAPATLRELRRLGVADSLMLTGDARETAEHVAAELGLTHVRAECLPADKVAAVQAVDRRPVMMVGDGVNDAPVLAAADVGVAMGARGATAASESADVVIMVDDLVRVATAVQISQRTIRVAVQSIGIGIGLSVVLMVLAAFGAIPAIVGAGLQEVVDLVTILNALRALTGPVAATHQGEPSGAAGTGLPLLARDRKAEERV